MYMIARNWGVSVRGAILCCCLFMFDNLNLTEARLILVDSQLIFWVAAALLVAQHWWKRQNEHVEAVDAFAAAHGGRPYSGSGDDYASSGRDPRLLTPLERTAWCVACGFVFANAFSVKWTGLATPAMIGLESLMGLFFLRRAVPWLDLLRVALVAVCTYAHWFWWHFHIGVKTGEGLVGVTDGWTPGHS